MFLVSSSGYGNLDTRERDSLREIYDYRFILKASTIGVQLLFDQVGLKIWLLQEYGGGMYVLCFGHLMQPICYNLQTVQFILLQSIILLSLSLSFVNDHDFFPKLIQTTDNS